MPTEAGMPDAEWRSLTHRFRLGGHKGYVTVAVDSDDCPVLLEIRMAKEGGTLRGLLDCLAASISLGLQQGVPLEAYVQRLAHVRFEPEGWTEGGLGYAHSVVDYIARWLALRFPQAAAAEGAAGPFEGEICRVCGAPLTWDAGTACPECGDIAPRHG